MSDIEMNQRDLDQLIKALKGGGSRLPKARVGILGDKTARSGGPGITNAEVGAKHEFGDEGMPIRSFLRMPITEKLQDALAKSGAFDENALKEIIKSGSIYKWMEKVGISAEACVAEAFATGGFGKWKPSNMENKVTKQTLVETQQLRNSVTSTVKW